MRSHRLDGYARGQADHIQAGQRSVIVRKVILQGSHLAPDQPRRPKPLVAHRTIHAQSNPTHAIKCHRSPKSEASRLMESCKRYSSGQRNLERLVRHQKSIERISKKWVFTVFCGNCNRASVRLGQCRHYPRTEIRRKDLEIRMNRILVGNLYDVCLFFANPGSDPCMNLVKRLVEVNCGVVGLVLGIWLESHRTLARLGPMVTPGAHGAR